MLDHIRSHGPLSRRDLQRKFAAMNSRNRDEVIAKLVGEGLFECEGRRVSAVPLSDFIGWLQERPEFPKRLVQFVESPDTLKRHNLALVEEIMESAGGQRRGEIPPDRLRTSREFRVPGGLVFS